MGVRLLAFAWGLAEGTFFFLAPDLPISFIALGPRRRALAACLLAVAGAIVGGAAMYAWGDADPERAAAAMEWVPAVDRAMIERVEQNLASDGLFRMFVGSVTGVPYKLYAIQSPGAGIHPLTFLLVSIPARLLRFTLVALLVGWLSNRWAGSWTRRRKVLTLAGFWVLFYTAFFSLLM